MINEYLSVFIFLILALGFTIGGLAFSFLVRDSNPSNKKSSTYECGEEPIGTAWIQFNMRYYLFALVFVIFDVEVIFLYPWAIVFKETGLLAFFEMIVFLGVLIIGLVYVWKKDALKWE
ncbi:MAG: NADH-quinone oxidoreductase subunit A [Candidatus Firestonebacteria bacterium]